MCWCFILNFLLMDVSIEIYGFGIRLYIRICQTYCVSCVCYNFTNFCNHCFFQEEPLVGENRYACSYCGGKQDGIRRVYITRAPSLLCVQLLRFTYDPRTGQRKKSKATIRLPDTLELSALSPTSSCNQSDHAAACLIPGVGKFGETQKNETCMSK